MNIYWYILIGLALLYYGYVYRVLSRKKKSADKKDFEKLDNLQNNHIFANNSSNEQTDFEAVLSQVDEVENNPKLLEAFEKGSSDEDDNSLTLKKHEKLKVIRSKDSVEDDSTNSES